MLCSLSAPLWKNVWCVIRITSKLCLIVLQCPGFLRWINKTTRYCTYCTIQRNKVLVSFLCRPTGLYYSNHCKMCRFRVKYIRFCFFVDISWQVLFSSFTVYLANKIIKSKAQKIDSQLAYNRRSLIINETHLLFISSCILQHPPFLTRTQKSALKGFIHTVYIDYG